MWRLADVTIDLVGKTRPVEALLAFQDQAEIVLSEPIMPGSPGEADLATEKIRESAERIASAAHEYDPAIGVVATALQEASKLVRSIGRGETYDVEFELSRWEDVNRTLGAIRDLETEVEKSGIRWEEVLEFSIDVLGIIIKRLIIA